MRAHQLRPFVPSGEDFALAVQFYTDLGFENIYGNHQGAIFKVDETEFHLQNYHNVELQPMMQPYGKRAIHLIDPAGVLWHFTE
ncbi:hypothetical protein ASG89_07585 [Paenibacillus sp. Soil766]|uniref:hypothetical protein n=1 Tax=Paenibacillus sp. Soil766 TaxID=1736404 RepID=UPI00070B9DD2|nr:hypothetical protein [Paenibacillus sp. Soil766]KRE93348.1 hypothetical protein ASG89_07585 [Paenibacillus sp. Soil766]